MLVVCCRRRDRGFDEHIGYFQGAVDYWTHVGGGYSGTAKGLDWHRGNQTDCFADSGQYTAGLVEHEAVSFIHRMAAAKQKFFL